MRSSKALPRPQSTPQQACKQRYRRQVSEQHQQRITQMPKGWGPASAAIGPGTGTSIMLGAQQRFRLHNSNTTGTNSSSVLLPSTNTKRSRSKSPSRPKSPSRSKSPSRGSSRVAAAVAAAATAERVWREVPRLEDMRSWHLLAASQKAEQAVKQKSERLEAAKRAAEIAAAEAVRLQEKMGTAPDNSMLHSGSSSTQRVQERLSDTQAAASGDAGRTAAAEVALAAEALDTLCASTAVGTSAATTTTVLEPPSVVAVSTAASNTGGPHAPANGSTGASFQAIPAASTAVSAVQRVKLQPASVAQAASDACRTGSVSMPVPPAVVSATDPRQALQVFQIRNSVTASSTVSVRHNSPAVAPSSSTTTSSSMVSAAAAAQLSPPAVITRSSSGNAISMPSAGERVNPPAVAPNSSSNSRSYGNSTTMLPGSRPVPHQSAAVPPNCSATASLSLPAVAPRHLDYNNSSMCCDMPMTLSTDALSLNPPAVVLSSSSSSTSAVFSADASLRSTDSGAAEFETAATADSVAAGMQWLAAVVGCAAVGTVMWSEFVLKETGVGLPPGPYGLLSAAEGLSYLAVLGLAGAGVAARGASGGKKGLPGALVVPEVMAYGALAAGLLVVAAQLQQHGYYPLALPPIQSYQDAVRTYTDFSQTYPAVLEAYPGAAAAAAAPAAGAGDVPGQLLAQLADLQAILQAILSQIKSAAAGGIDQLALQEQFALQGQLAALQQRIDMFSANIAMQTSNADAALQLGILHLQDSLTSATTAVSSFVDMQLQQLDIPGKLEYVLDVLRKQEQVLVTELPKKFAELQRLAATSIGIIQETTLQAATAVHLPELLAALDESMGVLHDVLEVKIQQLDMLLTQLYDSCAAAASQLAAAALAAHEAGSAEAAAQLASLQEMLSTTITSVEEQAWAGYQQLALADHLSESLLQIRMSAAEAAAFTAAEVDKLQLEKQLAELETVSEAALSALSATAMDHLGKLELEQQFVEIELQAAAAAESLQAGLVQQYNQQLPVLQQQLSQLQDNLADLAANAKQGLTYPSDHAGPELEALMLQLQQSMEATMKAVAEVAASSADVASQQLQVASSNIEQVSGNVADSVTNIVGNVVDSTALQSAVQSVVGEVASSSADVASQQLQVANSNIGQVSGSVASAGADVASHYPGMAASAIIGFSLGRVSDSVEKYVGRSTGAAVQGSTVPAAGETVQGAVQQAVQPVTAATPGIVLPARSKEDSDTTTEEACVPYQIVCEPWEMPPLAI